MNKTDLSKQIALRMNITGKESLQFITTLCEVLEQEFEQGHAVSIQNFGSFIAWEQPERVGRNPRNGTPALIPAHKIIKFRTGKGLLESLNKK